MIYIGWNIYELILINGIGYNLLSKDIYIIKLVFSIILLIYFINFKKIGIKCKENEKKGYVIFLYIILVIIEILGLYLILHCFFIGNISNYSETYEKCCIDNLKSDKVYIYIFNNYNNI